MLSAVLRSDVVIRVSIRIMDTFVEMPKSRERNHSDRKMQEKSVLALI